MSKRLNPDIKISPKGRAYIPTETLVKRRLARLGATGINAERERLKDAVVEAAKVRHDAESDYWDAARRGSKCVSEEAALQQANCDLRVAVGDLVDHERPVD